MKNSVKITKQCWFKKYRISVLFDKSSNTSGGKFISMNEYHNNKQADVKFFGAKNGQCLHTLITDDGLNVIAMEMFKRYNVYYIKSDS